MDSVASIEALQASLISGTHSPAGSSTAPLALVGHCGCVVVPLSAAMPALYSDIFVEEVVAGRVVAHRLRGPCTSGLEDNAHLVPKAEPAVNQQVDRSPALRLHCARQYSFLLGA